jgi:hypothetical protein
MPGMVFSIIGVLIASCSLASCRPIHRDGPPGAPTHLSGRRLLQGERGSRVAPHEHGTVCILTSSNSPVLQTRPSAFHLRPPQTAWRGRRTSATWGSRRSTRPSAVSPFLGGATLARVLPACVRLGPPCCLAARVSTEACARRSGPRRAGMPAPPHAAVPQRPIAVLRPPLRSRAAQDGVSALTLTDFTAARNFFPKLVRGGQSTFAATPRYGGADKSAATLRRARRGRPGLGVAHLDPPSSAGRKTQKPLKERNTQRPLSLEPHRRSSRAPPPPVARPRQLAHGPGRRRHRGRAQQQGRRAARAGQGVCRDGRRLCHPRPAADRPRRGPRQRDGRAGPHQRWALASLSAGAPRAPFALACCVRRTAVLLPHIRLGKQHLPHAHAHWSTRLHPATRLLLQTSPSRPNSPPASLAITTS